MNFNASMKLEIKIIPGAEAAGLVNSFYQEHGSKAVARDVDTFFVAFNGADVVGAVRFCVENDTPLLRTMMIHKDYRRQKIGQLLLAAFKEYLEKNQVRDTYCLPYAHLLEFYGSIGFKLIEEKKAPLFLQERLLQYRKQPELFACMVRS